MDREPTTAETSFPAQSVGRRRPVLSRRALLRAATGGCVGAVGSGPVAGATGDGGTVTIEARSPNASVAVAVDEPITFEARANDSEGRLAGVEWYVDGAFLTASSVAGTTESASLSWTATESSSFILEAIAYDETWTYSQTAATWRVDARGTSFRDRGVYVWGGARRLVTDADATERFFETSAAAGVRTVFLSWGALDGVSTAEIAAFVRAAHERDLAVHALVGTLGTEGLDVVRETLRAVLTFCSERPATERFDGVHADAEPRGPDDLSEFLDAYVGLLDDVPTIEVAGESIASLGLSLSAAVAWWWALPEYEPERTGYIAAHESIDWVVVMAYWDTAAEITRRLATVVETIPMCYALAVETAEFATERSNHPVTLYEEGRTTVDDVLAEVAGNPPSPGYLGAVYHYYGSALAAWHALRDAALEDDRATQGEIVSVTVTVCFDDPLPASTHRNTLLARFEGPETYTAATTIAPENWHPTETKIEWQVPRDVSPGEYAVTVALVDMTFENRDGIVTGTRDDPVELDRMGVGTLVVSS